MNLDPITRLAHQAGGAHDAEFLARVAWACITEPGDANRGRLITQHGAAEALRQTLTTTTPVTDPDEQGFRECTRTRFNPDTIRDVIATSETSGYRILTPTDEGWPVGLADLGETEPVCLWVRGNPAILSAPSVAVIGARAATGYGEHVTMTIVQDLTAKGWTIVAGAAYGIDGMAHRAALADRGNTVAVLAGGVDRFYPTGHDALLTRIAEAGAVVSEAPIGTPPTKWRFLQRNRIIAAMTQKTIVIEARHRSGSLNTAAHAAAIGRPVGAVPGPITSAASAGSHRLIREHGAALITSAAEVDEL